MPSNREDLPSTLKRSPEKVRRTYEKTLESAHEEYKGDEERAHRVAWASVKDVAEKEGDHWEVKEHTGPSDPRAEQSYPANRDRPARSYGGVDVSKSRSALLADAREAGIRGRSKMTKDELADALERYNDRQTAAARRR